MQEIVNNILGTFLGVLLGVPAGFALNYAWGKRVDAKRRGQLWSAIKDSVDKNAYLVGQIEEWVGQPDGILFFNVDLPLLESTASLKYEVLDDIELCREIDHLHYELVHLSRKVDILLELEFNPSARKAIDHPKGSRYNILRPPLIESIKSHLPALTKTIRLLQSKLQRVP